MSAPPRTLQAGERRIALGERPLLMGIVNATPDSFSDGGVQRTLSERVELAGSLLTAGADIIDIGGESGVTNRPPVEPEEEIRRVVPVIERVVGELGALVSVDTYKPAVARAAVAAGASIVNDVSGLLNPGLADVCAQTGAGLVVMHTRARPKQQLHDRAYDGRIVDDVLEFLTERTRLACERGVASEQLIVDPGPDFGKTPAQTIEVMRALPRLHELGYPVLLAASRKDFVGAITLRAPRQRLGGTLAAVAFGVEAGAHILRLHDIAQAADYLAVRDVLAGRRELDPAAALPEDLRREQGAVGSSR